MSPPGARARVFVALALGPELGARLAAAVQPALAGTDFRPPRAAGLHLTLVFLGALAGERLEPLARGLRAALRGVRAPHLRLETTGGFPDLQRARVLWVGVSERPPGRLAACRAAALEGLRRGGWEPRKGAAEEVFRAHVTVGRARRRDPCAPEAFRTLEVALEWVPEALELLESRAEVGGNRYLLLERIPLVR